MFGWVVLGLVVLNLLDPIIALIIYASHRLFDVTPPSPEDGDKARRDELYVQMMATPSG